MEEPRDRRLLILVVFAVIAVGAVLGVVLTRGDDGNGGESSATAGVEGCEEATDPEPKDVKLDAPEQEIQKGDVVTAVVETSCGTFEIALDTERAPKTANSFAYLSEEGFYDGLKFHRIATSPQFGVIQGGDPLGSGIGGPGYSVDEKPPSDLAYTKGVVAMAKSAAEPPGRSGSQFFVVTSPDLGLPPDYALVGEVSEGLDVVERIGSLGKPDESPKQTVLIDSITIEEG
jgi:cyclophilin family peptidyl-prolyl cis-trans isomerase